MNGRRDFLLRLLAGGLVFGGAGVAPAVMRRAWADQSVCPKCGAPLQPGAAFCGQCGHKLEAPGPAASAAPDNRGLVVQVVTAHDNELTSTYASLAYQKNLRVDSILGSAFAVAPGEFVTEGGLLIGARQVTLRTASGRSVPAQIVGADPMIGVALLKSDAPEIAPLSLRKDEPPREGESLRVLGYPSGARANDEPVLSTGVVSGVHRGGVRIHPIEDYFQTDASLPHGFAGGPMLDDQDRVVGMSTGMVFGSRVLLGPQSGIGYAIPAEWIARALAWIRSGAPPRGWIGAYVVPADSESRSRYKLPPQVKLFADQVFPGSPADSAGLKRGDGILKVQGEEYFSLSRLQGRLLDMKPETPVAFEVTRAGETRSLSLTLAPRPEKLRLAGLDALRFFGDVELTPRDEDTLVVAFVTPGSEVAHAKIAVGDLLQSVLSKKDWEHGAKDNSRWRSVHTVADLESRMQTAYSDLDFCLGLRFKSKDGTKHELLVWEILSPTAAL
jgi:S1-C subfamily serine protease